MSRNFVVLCSEQLKDIVRPENEACPQADPKPTLAGHVLGTYATAEIAEKAIMSFNCPGKHYITEAIHFKRVTI